MAVAIMALDGIQVHAPVDEPIVATPSLEDLIRERAHEIWLARGGEPGSDVSNWLDAEEEILRELK